MEVKISIRLYFVGNPLLLRSTYVMAVILPKNFEIYPSNPLSVRLNYSRAVIFIKLRYSRQPYSQSFLEWNPINDKKRDQGEQGYDC